MTRPLTLLLLIAGLFSDRLQAQSNTFRPKGYDLAKPDRVLVLPDTLREISGVTMLDEHTVACVQDENGIVFLYDVTKEQIREQFTFHLDGDYEGIARVGLTALYVLRSDGSLYGIEDYRSKDPKVSVYETGIPVSNNEGLCHDGDRLLIGCKSKPGKGELKNHRVIYGFDLKTKQLSEQPVFDFNINDVRRFARQHHIPLPVRSKSDGNKEEVVLFSTSAIAIHPLQDKLYLISSKDPMLLVFDRKGKLEHMELLDPKLFNKAEGITFFENGDMLISNEAKGQEPTLLRFNYK